MVPIISILYEDVGEKERKKNHHLNGSNGVPINWNNLSQIGNAYFNRGGDTL